MMKEYRNNTIQSDNEPMNSQGGMPNKNQAQFPQFGNINLDQKNINDSISSRIESAKSNGWGAQVSSFASEHKKSIVIGFVAILLFAGGSLISRNAEVNNPENNVAGVSTSSFDENNAENGNESKDNGIASITLDENGQLVIEESGPISTEAQENKNKSEIAEAEQKRTVQRQNGEITVSAERGDGITHLARTALSEHLNETGKSLTPEQKVYAEDYVQNRIGSHGLEVGDKLSFSQDLLEDAISKAQALEDWQIENLKKYTR